MIGPRHLLLIGLPGAGKSTAGRLVAERLGTHCTDIDPMLERATGRSVAELFTEEGEDSFRDREHLAVVQALGLPAHVVAPGGGWAARPGNLDAVADRSFTVHLAVSPGVAARRLEGDRLRPLLQGPDREAALGRLAEHRLPFYRRADVEIDVSGMSAERVADAILAVARDRAGWS